MTPLTQIALKSGCDQRAERLLGDKATAAATSILKQRVSLSTRGPLEASAEFRIGLGSVPYLADHGFQDMVVLPGSVYVEMALTVDRELSQRVPSIVRNIIFRNPIILGAEDVVIKVEVRNHGDRGVEYTFYEGSVEDGGALVPPRQYAARLEIDRNRPTPSTADSQAFSVEAFQAQSHAVIDGGAFYKTLHENGNQYGPRFQNLSTIWRAGDQSLGRLSVAPQLREIEPHYLHPSLLDSMTQLLAPFTLETGKTFILRSIEKIDVRDLHFPDTLWGHATRLPQGDGDEKGFLGNVRVFDQSGRGYVELSRVAFTLLDRVDVAGEKPATNLVIASNFTAEPVEDSLRFWGDFFGVQLGVDFAPYNQIFQQLLDTGSAFRRNSDGTNVLLLGLEEWTVADRHAPLGFNKERVERRFGARARCVLPNGLEVVHLNKYETDYLYKEIFEDQCYLRHGIRLQDGATVVDIGANIGLFSLFVMNHCKNSKVYACEPAPVLYDLLKANCDAYGSNVRALNIGVSDRLKTATFTFYEKSSVFSGFHPDETEDREAIRAVVRNMLKSEAVAGESVEEYVNELTADGLRGRTHECQLISVSAIIREHQIDKIDLLKIDAEKSELDIIKGIDDGDWPKIRQIVIETHDRTQETVKQVEALLIEKGYCCAREQETLLEHAGLFNLYATRDEAADETRTKLGTAEAVANGKGQAHRKRGSLERNIQDFCAALRSFMNQSKVPLVLGVCPRTPAAMTESGLQALLDDAEQVLLSEAGQIANVHCISSAALLQRYPVTEYYDPHTHQVADVPYTPECYAAIGTALVRTIFNLKKTAFKVIVLDCDNTLWKGVCGEDGPFGIEVPTPYRALQEFAIRQMHAGMLLCLCSKNNEKDVLEVFDKRTDMLLKREHLVAWRVNWSSKSENIRSLANELHLGLDSFIFIDDNPVECADVRINCPGVLTLQLPPNTDSFSSFLEHVWAFDHGTSTKEDRDRTTPGNSANLTPHRRALAFGPAYSSERLQRIGENLYDVPAIAKAIEEFLLRTQPIHAPADGAPEGTLEAALRNIWGKVLGRPRIGVNDNFFEAGGTSLRAVQVIAMIKKELKQSLSIVSLFENPTVALLAARLGAAPGRAVPQGATATGAALRGQQRRQNAIRRRAS